MLEKGKIYEAVISDYTAEGQGVAKIDGCAVFIPNALVGEKCLVRIEKAQKTWAAGKITEHLEKSPHRVNRLCPVAKLCGGCAFWHMDYEEECRMKAERVRQALNRIGEQKVFLWAFEKNIRARKFYEKHGFRRDGSRRISEFDGAIEVRYSKSARHSDASQNM